MSALLNERYTDAYAVARTLIRWGGRYKALGRIVLTFAAVLTAMSLFFGLGTDARNLPPGLSGATGAVGGIGVFFALLIVGFGMWCIARGVMMSAQGQLLLAHLDTAVHTSPFLSDDEKRGVLGLSSEAPALAGALSGRATVEIVCRRCHVANPPSNRYCEQCGAELDGARV